MKKIILEYTISTGICALLAFLIMVIGGIFATQEQFRIYALICDGCFISGIIFVCLGLLFFIYNSGFFDIISYGFMRFFSMFKKNPREVKYETLYDYKTKSPLLIFNYRWWGIHLDLGYLLNPLGSSGWQYYLFSIN